MTGRNNFIGKDPSRIFRSMAGFANPFQAMTQFAGQINPQTLASRTKKHDWVKKRLTLPHL